MVTKQSWKKLRAKKNIDLNHLLFGLNLNKTINLSYEKLKDCMFVLKNSPEYIEEQSKIINHAIMQLDAHFNITYLLNKSGKPILILK